MDELCRLLPGDKLEIREEPLDLKYQEFEKDWLPYVKNIEIKIVGKEGNVKRVCDDQRICCKKGGWWSSGEWVQFGHKRRTWDTFLIL